VLDWRLRERARNGARRGPTAGRSPRPRARCRPPLPPRAESRAPPKALEAAVRELLRWARPEPPRQPGGPRANAPPDLQATAARLIPPTSRGCSREAGRGGWGCGDGACSPFACPTPFGTGNRLPAGSSARRPPARRHHPDPQTPPPDYPRFGWPDVVRGGLRRKTARGRVPSPRSTSAPARWDARRVGENAPVCRQGPRRAGAGCSPQAHALQAAGRALINRHVPFNYLWLAPHGRRWRARGP